MTRKFPSIPALHDGTPLGLAGDHPRQLVTRGGQLPNRQSAGAWFSFGGVDNVAGNFYGQIGAVGAWAEWDVVVPPNLPGYGWGMSIVYYKGPNAGIFTISVNGVQQGVAIDSYNATAIRGAAGYWWVNDTPGSTTRAEKWSVRLTCTGKNAAASGTGHFYPLWFSLYESLI